MEFILGFISASIGSLITWIIFSRKNWGEIVSTNRMDWINGFRNEISMVLILYSRNLCKPIVGDSNCQYSLEEIIHSRNVLISRLNVRTDRNAENNQRLIDLLTSLESKAFSLTRQDYNEIMALSKDILEQEWKRVKREAKGKERK